MTRNDIERVLEKYAGHKDEAVRAQLARLRPVFLEKADIVNRLTDEDVRFSMPEKNIVAEALRGKIHLAETGCLNIAPGALLRVLERMAKTVETSFGVSSGITDFSIVGTGDFPKLAATNPGRFADKALSVLMDEKAATSEALPLAIAISLTTRIFFEAFAEKASAVLEAEDDPVVDYDRPNTCPVCGGLPDLAAVVPTERSGNVKKLFCNCCGASWKYERIRCSVCGDSVVSDLEYVHDEADEAHRLHVCKKCGSSFPTYFSKGEAFVPEVETVVIEGLARAFAA